MASNGSASTEQENSLAYLNDLHVGKVKILRELITTIETFFNLIDGVVHL